MTSNTGIKDLGNDLFEISCYPAVCFMFEVVEFAEVGVCKCLSILGVLHHRRTLV